MTRAQLEHVIRASGAIANVEDIVVGASQFRGEADVFPLHRQDLSDLIDGAIGEGSPFEAQFGYYAHGVDETTSVLPPGWRDRLILVQNENTRGVRGWCLEIHDLAIAKLIAGREKDLDFLDQALRHRLINAATLRDRLRSTSIDATRMGLAQLRLNVLLPEA